MEFWYKDYLTWQAKLLLPISLLVKAYALRKRDRRSIQHCSSGHYGIPVVVVGNITVGGTGKTPMIIWLANQLSATGMKVGVVSRGYGAQPERLFPIEVQGSDSAKSVGDEPKLIQSLTAARVVIDPNRHQAVQFLVDSDPSVDVIISDDGMQHYAMQRDLEILMVDGERQFGNKQLIPAGPLREPLSRLDSVDFTLVKCHSAQATSFAFKSKPAVLIANAPKNKQGDILPLGRVVLCSGIGNFNSFRNSVEQLGYEVVEQLRYKDHEAIPTSVLKSKTLPIIVTEKDMIKIDHNIVNVFALPIELKLDHDVSAAILSKIQDLKNEKSRYNSSAF